MCVCVCVFKFNQSKCTLDFSICVLGFDLNSYILNKLFFFNFDLLI